MNTTLLNSSPVNFFVVSITTFLLCLLGLIRQGCAQTPVAGPVCALPGVEYQYTIAGAWDSTATISICVTGGVISGTREQCYNGKPVSYIRVIWNEKTPEGLIALSSGSQKNNFPVRLTKPLVVEDPVLATRVQIRSAKTKADDFQLPVVSGGGCDPQYEYQWEQSEDLVTWGNVAGIKTKNFKFSAALPKTKYYRCLVTDRSSNATAYSKIWTVIVDNQK